MPRRQKPSVPTALEVAQGLRDRWLSGEFELGAALVWLLEAAGAPEQWQNPDVCGDANWWFSLELDEYRTEDMPDVPDYPTAKVKNMQDCIDFLRDGIPELISNHRLIAAWKGFLSPEEYERRIAPILKMHDALTDIAPLVSPDRRSTPRADWHFDAWRLFALYREVVASDAGMSRHGPAGRFVQAALFRLHKKEWTLEAVELAVTRWEASRRMTTHTESPFVDR